MYHGNLSVLFHPNSGRPKMDHLENGLWIKSILTLNGKHRSEKCDKPEFFLSLYSELFG